MRSAAAMIPRSAAGRAIVAEASSGGKSTVPAVKQSQERTITLEKKTRDSLLGVRFGLHPTTGQVVVTELFSGYPAMECGKIFVGDVLTAVDGVRITEVDMATQLIKLAQGKVKLKTSNVYVVGDTPPPPPPLPSIPASYAAVGTGSGGIKRVSMGGLASGRPSLVEILKSQLAIQFTV